MINYLQFTQNMYISRRNRKEKRPKNKQKIFVSAKILKCNIFILYLNTYKVISNESVRLPDHLHELANLQSGTCSCADVTHLVRGRWSHLRWSSSLHVTTATCSPHWENVPAGWSKSVGTGRNPELKPTRTQFNHSITLPNGWNMSSTKLWWY